MEDETKHVEDMKELKHEADPRFVKFYYTVLGIGSLYLFVVFMSSLW